MDMLDNEVLEKNRFRHIFVIIDNFNKNIWCIPPKNKYGQTLTDEFSKNLTISKPSPIKVESERGKEFYDSVSQNFLKVSNRRHFSGSTNKCPSVADRVIRTIRNPIKKPVFLKVKANWVTELPPISKQYNNTIHHSTKLTPIEAYKNVNEKAVFTNLRDKRKKHKPHFHKVKLARTADIKK